MKYEYTTKQFIEDITNLDYHVRLREFGNGLRVITVEGNTDYFDGVMEVADIVDNESKCEDETINIKTITEVGLSIESIEEIKLLEYVVKYVKQTME